MILKLSVDFFALARKRVAAQDLSKAQILVLGVDFLVRVYKAGP